MKDCTTCKYGYEDERLGIPMCHHPKRFSDDCVDFNMHEEKEIKKSEKSMNPDGLEEEIHKYNKERFDEYFPEQDGDFISEVDFMTCLDRVADHFAKWGAEHAREQMMNEAVEGEITKDNRGNNVVRTGALNNGFEIGDKVRIIIVKED